MKIQTKFDIGDTIHFKYGSESRTGTVNSITVISSAGPTIGITTINYGVKEIPIALINENDVFPTKEELLKKK